MQEKVPSYLLGKFQLAATVVFAALFAIVAVALASPYADMLWFRIDTSPAFGYTVYFFGFSFLLVAISRMSMHYVGKLETLTWLQYMVWTVIEIDAVAFLYTFLTFKASSRGIIAPEIRPFEDVLASSLLYTLVCLGVPYLVAGMYFAILDRDKTIRLMNYTSVISDSEPLSHETQKITLFDNSGALKLAVSISNLYFIESDDNYIKVWYRDSKGELRQYMLRCRLKSVEDTFAGSDLVRCHRKYMINMTKVTVLTKEKECYYVDLGLENLDPIPVSKTYEATIISKFNSR